MRTRKSWLIAGTIILTLMATAIGAFVKISAHGNGVAAKVALTPDHISLYTLTFPPDTNYCLANLGIHCYQPAQMQKAYDLAPLFAHHLNGHGRTIAVVDSFGSPTIANDLHVFDQTFNLPDPPSLKIIQPAGAVPPFDPNNSDMAGWAQETTLDVEWSHVMAPGANILLVETPVSETEGVQGFPEIVKAENFVINHSLADVISQSFGATEETFPNARSILNLRSAFENAHDHNVTVLASSGDSGATDNLLDTSCCYPMRVNSWPSSDPLVTSVGGTMLDLDENGNRLAPDVVWNDGFGAGGGGVSSVFERPSFQNHVADITGRHRGTPDISLSAAVDGAVVYYYSFIPGRVGYHLVGGTSEASPLFAGVVAIADQAAGHRLGLLNHRLYRLERSPHSGIVDVTSGNNSFTFTDSNNQTVTVTGFNAGPGYDLASGLGTIDAAKFVPALAGDHDGGDDD